MVLVDRDYVIMGELEHRRFCLGRHIRILADFSGGRACDRRLKALIEAGYTGRKKILYGVPGLYYLTYKGKMVIGANKRQDKIRVEKISHDTAVSDTVIFFIQKYGVNLENIITEKQLYSRNGFTVRTHYPDFTFKDADKNCCAEIELTAKAKHRLEKNIEHNYPNHEARYRVVPKPALKIRETLKELSAKYMNIKIINLEEVQEFVRENK